MKKLMIVFLIVMLLTGVLLSGALPLVNGRALAGEDKSESSGEDQEKASGEGQEKVSGEVQENQSKASGESSGETIHIRAGRLNYMEERIEVRGGITIIKGDNNITAPRGIYFKEESRAELEGDVLLKHSKGEIKSLEMTALLTEDKYIFRRKVELKQQLEKEGGLQLETSYLVLFAKDKSFTAEQGVVISYDQRILKADRATYNDREQTLKLTGNVYIEEESGDWVKSRQATFYLETGEFSADGEVELELKISSN